MTSGRARALHASGALGLVAAGLAACSDGSTGPQAVASLDVSPTAITLFVGQTASLAGTPRDASGNALTDRTVTWESDDPAVVGISSPGVVSGLATGTATVTATAEGVGGSASVTVLPRPVASVEVTPPLLSILPGDTLRLAAVARDAQDNIVVGRTFAWVSDDVTVATVDAAGLVMGRAPGAAVLYATTSGVAGSADVDVVDPQAPRITTVTPAAMVEGQPATLHGVNFDAVPATNVVDVDGVRATVTAATDSTLDIEVPALGCRPPHQADIDVAVGNLGSRFSHPARPATTLQVPVGQMAILQDPTAYCLQFDTTTADQQYLFGVQSTLPNAGSVSSVMVTSDAADGSPSSVVAPPAAVEEPPGVPNPLPFETAWRAREAEVMRREIEQIRDLPRPGVRPLLTPPAQIPGTVVVGDTVTVRYPNLQSANTCQNYVEIHGTVRYVSAAGIWVSDDANPIGYTDADYVTLGSRFETTIYPNQTSYFGPPADMDGNGRIVMVVTKEVNDDEIGGIVPTANLFDPGTCPVSNGPGEYFFMFTADPGGLHGIGVVSVANALSAATAIIGHELVHNIHISRRYIDGHTLWESWMHEGQATLGEEVLGHAINGRGPGNDYGWSIVRNQPVTADRAWYFDNIRPLFLYYGWSPATGLDPQAEGSVKRLNAPEGCTWLDTPTGENAGLCADRGLLVYGVTWSFLRWISDHYGPTFGGGESALHRAWIDGAQSGFASLEAVTGEPIDELLARWAASLYLDNRVAGLDPLLTLPSYDLANIEANVVPEARLAPRARAFTDFEQLVQVRAGSSAYFLVSGANRPATAIRIRDASGAFVAPGVQVWVVRTR